MTIDLQTPTAGDPVRYDPAAIFAPDGPFEPNFMHEAIRTLMRALPLSEEQEPERWIQRRLFCALRAVSAMHPRDEIEVMLSVQAVAAYHAAALSWHVGVNLRAHPKEPGKTRHLAAAASASRTFDTLLKALERRQAKPLMVPPGRPDGQVWPVIDLIAEMNDLARRCGEVPGSTQTEPPPEPVLSDAEREAAAAERERIRIEEENRGLDIANTEGIRPDGSIIMPANPTPQQAAYVARRLALMYRREVAENRRKGITVMPEIRPLRTGDLVP